LRLSKTAGRRLELSIGYFKEPEMKTD